MPQADSTLRVVNDSGFPLQIAVERQVSDTSGTHGWTVRYVEHSWSNSSEGQAGFIDLVLQDKHKTTFAVVECKRVRDAEWIFLHSAGRAPVERNAKGWISHYANRSMAHYGWHELSPFPACVEAEYCAIRGQSTSDRTTLLERVGSELLSATEALAAEERDLRPATYESFKLYFSLLVTTADLKLGAFDPSKISLKDGTLPDAQCESVPYLRFRKQLSIRQMRFSPTDYSNSTNIAYAKQHTVFVVRADALPRFLNDLYVPAGSLRHLPAG